MYHGKRTLDLLIAIPALVITFPIQVIAALFIRSLMGKPVIFTQERPGRHGLPFTMRKFRTMQPVDLERGWTTDRARLTKVGSILRTTSIDELPTIWNVVRGDMSIVGPRPLLMKYVDLYSPQQARRMEVLPGLTGLAQVNGRNAQTWDERFAYDINYIDTCSLSTDLRIIAKTVRTVLNRNGIAAHGDATMPEFRGNSLG